MSFSEAVPRRLRITSRIQGDVPQTYSEIALGDGRVLAYAEYGRRDGYPVLFFPGLGHSHLARHPDESVTRETGARLIVVDRPGIGRSTGKGNRTIVDYSDDVAQLLHDLDIPRAALVGWSAGSAYALATAAVLPTRVSSMLVVSGVVPPDLGTSLGATDPLARIMLGLARVSGHLTRVPLAALRAQAQADPDQLLSILLARAPRCDKEVLAEPAIREMFAESYREGSSSGAAGLGSELALITRPWNFSLSRVRCPVRCVYGEQDRLTPAVAGSALAGAMFQSSVSVVPDAGHLLLWSHWSELLTRLVTDAEVEEARGST